MRIDVFDLIRIITSLQLLLVCLVLFIYKPGKALHKILGLFLFAQASYIICGIFSNVHYYIGNADIKWTFYFFYSFTYLLGPSLFLYVKCITDRHFKIRFKHAVHFILFLVFIVINPFYLHITSTDFFLFNDQLRPDISVCASIVLLHVQILSYLSYSLFILNRDYLNRIKGYLTVSGKNHLGWIRFLIISFLLVWMVESMVFFTYTYYYVFLCEVKIVLTAMQFIIANIIVFQGLKRPELLYGDPGKIKYNKNLIREEEKDGYLKRLKQYMETETPYYDPVLTLDLLAEKTGIPQHHISQLLNTVLHMSFYDYINSYRVEACKKQLLSDNGRRKTILEIMYDSGFSSKSVFNNAFKKYTGTTPTEFRNQFR